MSKIGTNIIVLLGIVTVLFGAYYFFTQEAALVLRSPESNQQLQELLVASETFVQRSEVLDNIRLDTSILQFDVFNSLQSFSPEPEEFSVGRGNPFVPVSAFETDPLVNDQQ